MGLPIQFQRINRQLVDMNIEKPLFSIIVPIYNEEQFIHEALDSIATQTDSDWEALLIDDGSTDSTPEILDEYANRDSRFRVIHKSNRGQSSAINLGVKESKGEWLCWLSGDDFFHPQKLEMNRRWIRDYPDKGFFFTGFWLIEPDGKKIEYDLDWLNLENPGYHLIQLFRANHVMGISICIKREAWLQNGGFDEKLRYAHDLDMWFRLMLNTPTQYIPERTCTMRYHPGQETAQFPLAPAFDAAKISIRLVNEHSLKDMLPFVNLRDGNTAKDTLNRLINFVIGVPDANIYRLGYHPLAQLRILEWLWDPSVDSLLREELRQIILNRAIELAAFYNKSAFGLLWKATGAALKIDQPCFAYFPCEADKIGVINYYRQRAELSEVAQPLRTYLEKFDDAHFVDAATKEEPKQLILLLPPDIALDDPLNPKLKVFRQALQDLIKTGFSILLVGKSKYTLGLFEGLMYLGAENEFLQNQLLTGLGDFDLAIAFSHSERLKWVRAERLISFTSHNYIMSGSELSAKLIHHIQSPPEEIFKNPIIKKGLEHVRKIYNFILPAEIREKMQLGQRLRAFRIKRIT